MAEEITIRPNSSAYLVVEQLQGRLQLFAGGDPWVATREPGSWRIASDREYYPVYDNNEGGSGLLSLWVASTEDEESWEATDYVIYFDDVDGEEVRDLPSFIVVEQA